MLREQKEKRTMDSEKEYNSVFCILILWFLNDLENRSTVVLKTHIVNLSKRLRLWVSCIY